MKTNSDIYGFSDKWSPDIDEYSFTQIPNLLLACQGHLRLTDGELLTLIHLLTYWFSYKSKVYPSIKTLTKFSSNGYSTIQKRLRTLEEKGFIKRVHKLGTSNTFDLVPCVKKLREHEKVCKQRPRIRAENAVKTIREPSSFTSNKEDEFLRRLNRNNTENNIFRKSPNFTFSDQSEDIWGI